jgi:hypothetical protein
MKCFQIKRQYFIVSIQYTFFHYLELVVVQRKEGGGATDEQQ